MSWKLMRFRDFLKRSKIPIEIQDNELYKRVTIKIKHNGVSLRDEEVGKQIGTKKQFILKAGQFILSKIDARYGAFGIAPEEVDGAIITGNFWAYDVDFSLVNIDWFNQFTNSQDFYDLCERASSGITHRKYLNEDSFLDNEIYLPSPEEQFQIIEEFKTNRDSINILSNELTHQLDLVKHLRQAFLREAMQGKLVPQDPNDEPASVLLEKIKAEKERLIKEKKIKKQKPLPPITEDDIPFEIPNNWVWCRLGEISQINPRNYLEDDLDVGFCPMPLIFSEYGKDVEYEIRKWKDIKSGFTHFANNDVVVAKITPCFQNSKAAIIKELPNGFGAGTTELYVMRSYINNTAPFIYSFVKTQDFLIEGERIMRGVAGQQRVPREFVESHLIPLPPLFEQQRIVARLDELMAYCDELKASIKESQQQNQMLLQQVLREALEPKTAILS